MRLKKKVVLELTCVLFSASFQLHVERKGQLEYHIYRSHPLLSFLSFPSSTSSSPKKNILDIKNEPCFETCITDSFAFYRCSNLLRWLPPPKDGLFDLLPRGHLTNFGHTADQMHPEPLAGPEQHVPHAPLRQSPRVLDRTKRGSPSFAQEVHHVDQILPAVENGHIHRHEIHQWIG